MALVHSDTLRLWDPIWGPGDEVFALGAPRVDTKFFMQDCSLYKVGSSLEPCDLNVHGVRLCAGSFFEGYFIGSYSHDIDLDNGLIDQGLHVWAYDKDTGFDFLHAMRLSQRQPHSDYFGGIDIKGKRAYAFRDPVPLWDGFAVVTGGWRWNASPNICYVNKNLSINRKSILSEQTRRCFAEIERPCFIEEGGETYMLFSAKRITDEGKRVLGKQQNKHYNGLFASRLRNGIFELYSPVEGSTNAYGMAIKDGRAAYWLRDSYDLVIPEEPNLVFDGGWRVT
jgi:hypothetical protein